MANNVSEASSQIPYSSEITERPPRVKFTKKPFESGSYSFNELFNTPLSEKQPKDQNPGNEVAPQFVSRSRAGSSPIIRNIKQKVQKEEESKEELKTTNPVVSSEEKEGGIFQIDL